MPARVGSVRLGSPVMTASGTAGRCDELAPYGRLDRLGAVVVKSLSADGWEGNPEPRLAPLPGGLINSIGLQNPGVARWLREELPTLLASGAKAGSGGAGGAGTAIVASIWGHTVDEFRRAADLLAEAPSQVVAVEVNLSCPNLSCPNTVAGRRMFSSSQKDTRAVLEATAGCGRPRWAKLSPASGDLADMAAAAAEGGAEAVVLVNTMPGMVIDVAARRPRLGGKFGGVSGTALHPVAVRAVYDVHAEHPELPIVGVGGVGCGQDAAELILAGASAVQVGTAVFADPRAPWRVHDELNKWRRQAGADSLNDLVGAAHG